MRFRLIAFALAAALSSAPLLAAPADQTVNVQFPRGATGKAFDGRVRGYDIVTYTLRANAGQTMSVTLSSQNTGANFMVIGPDGEAPMFNSASDGEAFQRRLEDSGVYKIKVSLMRNEARRGSTADYIIDFNVYGGSSAPPPSRPADYADSQSGGPDFWIVSGVGSGDFLNVRATPSTRARVVGQVGNGERVRNLGCNGNGWCRVEWETEEGNPNVVGWVAHRYLRGE